MNTPFKTNDSPFAGPRAKAADLLYQTLAHWSDLDSQSLLTPVSRDLDEALRLLEAHPAEKS
jgi:hypothetical protein